jgi:DNA repair ATPase RecN
MPFIDYRGPNPICSACRKPIHGDDCCECWKKNPLVEAKLRETDELAMKELIQMNKDLQAQIAQLQEQYKEWRHYAEEFQIENTKLKEEKEQMKNCQNCQNKYGLLDCKIWDIIMKRLLKDDINKILDNQVCKYWQLKEEK